LSESDRLVLKRRSSRPFVLTNDDSSFAFTYLLTYVLLAMGDNSLCADLY